jgi:nucleotide-binding universal stress UspA family protein
VKSLFGDPVAEIISYAEKENCGFIVMGTHGRKGLERVLLGSVTAGVISKSRIPVITMSDIT